MLKPTLQEEKILWKRGYKRAACLDEVGRGALCGPVVAAAVMIKKFSISESRSCGMKRKKRFISSPFNFQFSNIKDSKKLSPKRREEF